MPDSYSPEDEAARYVMGGFATAERVEFETRLAHSAQLRALVRELEEGAVALAMAAPQKRPLQQIWKQIEKTVAQETKRQKIVMFWAGWWRNGWAAAAACMVGWLLYALGMNQPGPAVSPLTADSEAPSRQRITVADSPRMKTRNVTPQMQTEADGANQLLQAKMRENDALRWQVVELKNQMTHLSQSVTQQQALLTESNRIKFFQLTSASDGSGAATTVQQLSPALQRALFLAMARELGWVQSANPTPGVESEGGISHWGSTNPLNVDFVDLRPNTNGTANPLQVQPKVQTQVAGASEPPPPPVAPGGTIPAFSSGDKLIVAVDSTIAPSGSHLTFSAETANQGQQPLGTAVLGDNPLVVMLPLVAASENGWTLTATAGTAFGISNIIHFSTPGTNNP